MNYIALNHPNSPEGKHAQNLLDKALKPIEDDTFDMTDTSANFKAIFTFSREDTKAIEVFKTQLSQAVKEETVFGLSLSEEIYDINTTFGQQQIQFILNTIDMIKKRDNYRKVHIKDYMPELAEAIYR